MVSAKSFTTASCTAHRRRLQSHYGHLSDTALLVRFRDGAPEALGVLIERHYPVMYSLALRYSDTPDAALDAMQDSIVRVLLSIHQLREDARFLPWMGRIVINSTRLLRRAVRRLAPLSPEMLASLHDDRPSPERLAAVRQNVCLVDRFLTLSRTGDRELFVWRFLEGLSIEELSQRTGLSESTVKVRIHRARKRLFAYFTIAGHGVADSISIAQTSTPVLVSLTQPRTP